MKKSVNIIKSKEWHKEIDFALVTLIIILFGSTVAYVMINVIK
jgi:hypothetical protein